jgi:hypothetical protein
MSACVLHVLFVCFVNLVCLVRSKNEKSSIAGRSLVKQSMVAFKHAMGLSSSKSGREDNRNQYQNTGAFYGGSYGDKAGNEGIEGLAARSFGGWRHLRAGGKIANQIFQPAKEVTIYRGALALADSFLKGASPLKESIMFIKFKCFSFSFTLEIKRHPRYFIVIEDVITSEQVKQIPCFSKSRALALATELTWFYSDTDKRSYNWVVYDDQIYVKSGAYTQQHEVKTVAVPFITVK